MGRSGGASTTGGRRWRDYRTRGGRRPVKEFIDRLSDADAATLVATMRVVALEGVAPAKHLRGDIYEVRADGDRVALRVLFAQEGKRGQVLLALNVYSKKTQKTPPQTLRLAERRLRDWRSRARRR
jgi:phage-related protein